MDTIGSANFNHEFRNRQRKKPHSKGAAGWSCVAGLGCRAQDEQGEALPNARSSERVRGVSAARSSILLERCNLFPRASERFPAVSCALFCSSHTPFPVVPPTGMLRRKPTVIELRLDTDKAEVRRASRLAGPPCSFRHRVKAVNDLVCSVQYEQLKRERENPGQQPTPIQQVGEFLHVRHLLLGQVCTSQSV